MAWKDNIDMEPFTLNKHIISFLIFLVMGSLWSLFVVYGPCNYSAKKVFWESLSLDIKRVPGAWLILGDFNRIFNASDRSSNRGMDKGSQS